jgi:15-cis-phytoene synthase
MSEAQEITKKSRSNLAFAFISLPKQTRQDITAFYAFCRKVDDAADDPDVSLADRQRWLKGWRRWLVRSEADEPGFAAEVRALIAKYKIDPQLFEEILRGVEMDLEPVRFEKFDALYRYCYRVAGAVGLVSIEIFGYKNPRCKEYAQKLGTALQLTNIIRDVDRDLRNGGRIYLPLSEVKMFGYSEQELLGRTYNGAFIRLMQFQAERARSFFREAQRLLPPEDRRSMVAAEGMRGIYHALLLRIEKDRFRMFEKQYRLTGLEKGIIMAWAAAKVRSQK